MSAARLQTVSATENTGAQNTAAVDAYRTTGTSPTPRARARRHRYDTVHLLGPGAVGRAFLERLATTPRVLVAVTDSTATVHDVDGLDPLAICAWKAAGWSLCDFPGARALPPQLALAVANADLIVDSSSTELGRAGWTDALAEALTRGACVAFAAKAAVCEAGAEWLAGPYAQQVGCNAVLGGTGLHFTGELTELRRRWRSVAIVGNATTTTILEAVERGATLAEGIAEAARLGFLEPDPELDLRGADAAVKLAIVAGVLTGRRIDPDSVPCADIRTIDLLDVRARARRGCTTRLVARLSVDGTLGVAYEELPADSVLAARAGQVVYDYQLAPNERRLHIGGGLGASATADAVWADVQALIASNTTTTPHVIAGGAR